MPQSMTALPNLKHLTLSTTEITGPGSAEHLNKLTQLECLSVPCKNFKEVHFETLKAAIPGIWQ